MMVTDTRPRAPGPAEVLAVALDLVRERLPDGWACSTDPAGRGRTGAPVIRIVSPDGEEATLLVEAKPVVQARDVAGVRERLTAATGDRPAPGGMVVGRYLSQSVRDRLAAAGLSYADATGNLLIRASHPGLLLSDRGADSDPWRGPGRPRGTLKGEPAAKVVRALVDLPGPWKVRDLVEASTASTGSVYRVLDFLDTEGLLTRTAAGAVGVEDWTQLLRRWSEDYQFVRTNTVTRWIAPRGLGDLQERMRASDQIDYAVTGTIAAARYAPYAPARAAMVLVAEPDQAAVAWGLRPAEAGVNVLLAQRAYPVLTARAVTSDDGLVTAAPAQVVADLLTGPGRSPSEAEELMTWMRGNVDAWRR